MGLVKIGAGMLAGAALLSGCWGQPGFGPGNTRHNDGERTLNQANVATLTERWSTDVAATWLSEPIVRGGRIYATAENPESFLGVKSFTAATGAPDWETQVAGVRGGASPVALSGDELWLSHNPGFCDAHLSRLDPDDGTVLGSEPAIIGGTIVTGQKVMAYVAYGTCPPQDPGRLFVRDAVTRATLWTFDFPEPNSPLSDVTVTIADGHIYVASASTLYAFDETCGAGTCSPIWTRTFAGRTLDRVAAAGGRVYVSARFAPPVTPGSAVLSALSATDGSTQWSRELERITGVAVTGANVFVIGAGPPANPTPDGVLFAFASTCGSPSGCLEWAAGYGQELPAGVAVAGNVLYVTTKPAAAGGDGALLAYAPSGCGAPTCPTPLLDLPTNGTPTEMSVANGRVLVTSQVAPIEMALTSYGLP